MKMKAETGVLCPQAKEPQRWPTAPRIWGRHGAHSAPLKPLAGSNPVTLQLQASDF